MVLVFKTSVRLKKQAKQLQPHLDKLLKEGTWNFDLQDCDKILRVAGAIKTSSEEIIRLLKDNGFDCAELMD